MPNTALLARRAIAAQSRALEAAIVAERMRVAQGTIASAVLAGIAERERDRARGLRAEARAGLAG